MSSKNPPNRLPYPPTPCKMTVYDNWEATYRRVIRDFFGGNADCRWENEFYLIRNTLSIAPDLFYELFRVTQEITNLKKRSDPLEIGAKWFSCGIFAVSDLRRYEDGRMVARGIIALLQDQFSRVFFPFSRDEYIAVTIVSYFRYELRHVQFAIECCKADKKMTIDAVFGKLEGWYLNDLDDIEKIMDYESRPAMPASKNTGHGKIVRIPRAWDDSI